MSVSPRVRLRLRAGRTPVLLAFLGGLLASRSPGLASPTSFVRGDVNRNGLVEMADAIRVFGFLFLGEVDPPCLDAADTNDSGDLDISDGVYVLGYLFSGGRSPPPPYPESGSDPTDDALGCDDIAPCTEWENSIGMRFVYIPPGSFLMGSPAEERGRWFVEGPVHKVNLTRGFYMGVTEVTQAEYLEVLGVNPSFFNGGKYGRDLRRPVEQVDVDDVEEFCRKLSEREGRSYRLPTEAEWEYACRAGTSTRFFFGDALNCGDECGPCPEADRHLWWCGNNEPFGTKPVGTREPNRWCLHDMSGSVWEWCADWTYRYDGAEAWDPTGPPTGSEKVIRGGYWGLGLSFSRSAMRGDLSTEHRYEFLGFRVVLEGGRGE